MAQKIQALGPSDRSSFASSVGDASPDTPSDTSTPEYPGAPGRVIAMGNQLCALGKVGSPMAGRDR